MVEKFSHFISGEGSLGSYLKLGGRPRLQRCLASRVDTPCLGGRKRQRKKVSSVIRVGKRVWGSEPSRSHLTCIAVLGKAERDFAGCDQGLSLQNALSKGRKSKPDWKAPVPGQGLGVIKGCPCFHVRNAVETSCARRGRSEASRVDESWDFSGKG